MKTSHDSTRRATAPGTATADGTAAGSARRVFYTLTVTRWFPVGFVVGILVLLATTRGLSTTQALTYAAVAGIVCFLLELPTSGFADAFGRRPVYLAAAGLNVIVALCYVLAHTFWTFVAAAALMGVFRALDSGPLEAWFVDAVHEEHPGKDVDQELSRAATLMGAAMALGAVLSGALIWWHPLSSQPPLDLVVWVYAAGNVIHLLATTLLLRHEAPTAASLAPAPSDPAPSGPAPSDPALPAPAPPVASLDPALPVPALPDPAWARARASIAQAPGVVLAGLRMMVGNPVLVGLLVAEAAWSIGMIAFESLLPLRLEELVGSSQVAGALIGPVSAGGWACYALGTWLAGILSARIGVARGAMVARVLNGLGIILMAWAMGPLALVLAYLFTYSMHGLNGPTHGALLHRQATRANRATVLSMNSMVAFLAFGVASPLAGAIGEHSSLAAAMLVLGIIAIAGVAAYLPARRAELKAGRMAAGDLQPVQADAQADAQAHLHHE